MPDHTDTARAPRTVERHPLTRGAADEALYAAYLAGAMPADAYIAYLRDELHAAWARLYDDDQRIAAPE